MSQVPYFWKKFLKTYLVQSRVRSVLVTVLICIFVFVTGSMPLLQAAMQKEQMSMILTILQHIRIEIPVIPWLVACTKKRDATVRSKAISSLAGNEEIRGSGTTFAYELSIHVVFPCLSRDQAE